MSDTRQAQTIPSLDGLRAISVLIVVMAHSGLDVVVPGGLGVTIFFFLSGYLISTLMLTEHERTGEINILKFYLRRIFRLMPPLFISLVIAYGLTWSGLLSGGITIGGMASQFLYFANYYGLFFDPGNTVPDGTGILWSLAVEEHFYIFYPILMTVLLGGTLRLRAIGTLLAIACLVILAWRIYLVQSPGFVYYRTYYASDTRIDSIMFGCILAVVMNPADKKCHYSTMTAGRWAIFTAAAGILLLTLLYRNAIFRETIRYSLQGVALMPLFYFVIRFSDNKLFHFLNFPWLARLGVYSYAIYLIHYIVIKVIATNAPTVAAKPFVVLPLSLLLSIAYAAVIDRFIDPYFRRLRYRLRTEMGDKAPSPAVKNYARGSLG